MGDLAAMGAKGAATLGEAMVLAQALIRYEQVLVF